MYIMSMSKWNSLKQLSIHVPISDKSCKYLSRMSMNSLTYLYLDGSIISSIGLAHLTKSDWKGLKQI